MKENTIIFPFYHAFTWALLNGHVVLHEIKHENSLSNGLLGFHGNEMKRNLLLNEPICLLRTIGLSVCMELE